MTKNTKRRAPKKENAEKSMFSNILYCADCGKKLWYHTNTTNKNIHYFSCSNYVKDYRGTCTSRHYVREDAIDQVVTLELQRLASFLKADEESFAELLAEKANKDMLTEKRRIEAELQKSINRNETVARLYEKLYEDNAIGKVSDEWFMELSHKYEQERITLKQKITDYRNQLSELSSDEQNKTSFISAVRKFMEMKTITAPLLRELVDHIDVYETQGVGKNRSQRIAIYYRFVGYIELPDFLLTDNIKAGTRNGVEVQYITQGESA